MRALSVFALLVLGCSSTPTGSGFTASSGGSNNGSGGPDFGGDGDGGLSCNPNPEAAEVPGNGCDDDGDGTKDNTDGCDASLSVTGSAPAFAQAIGLCKDAKGGSTWGLIRAEYRGGYNDPSTAVAEQFGILPKFGNVLKPREGKSLGVLSSGYGREYDGPSGTPSFNQGELLFGGLPSGGQTMHGDSIPPPGFPKATAGCPASAKNINDAAVVHLELKAPINAKGYAFDFNFFTSEWPRYLCSEYNDAFVAFVTREDGTKDNVSFDSTKNPVNVNLGFFDRCTPNVETTCSGTGTPKLSTCPGGPAELAGTGYGRVSNSGVALDRGAYCKDNSTGGGATGWLETQAPINPGEKFSIDFMIWDTGDALLDSSVLVDNFRWLVDNVTGSTSRPK